jgi:hypothetical protein
MSTLSGYARAPVPEDANLSRAKLEPAIDHRALLLYAMMDFGRRRYRRVAIALARTPATIQSWSIRWEWEARINRESGGDTAQARACQLYREIYYPEIGLREVALVEQNMSVSFLVTSPPPDKTTNIGDAQRQLITLANEPSKRPTSGNGGSKEIDNPVAEATRKLGRYSSLLEAMIAGFTKQVQHALTTIDSSPKAFQALGIKPRDMPQFIREWQSLQESLGALTPPNAMSPGFETSFRVREAQRTGASVSEAQLEDALECVAILQTIVSQEEADGEREVIESKEKTLEKQRAKTRAI